MPAIPAGIKDEPVDGTAEIETGTAEEPDEKQLKCGNCGRMFSHRSDLKCRYNPHRDQCSALFCSVPCQLGHKHYVECEDTAAHGKRALPPTEHYSPAATPEKDEVFGGVGEIPDVQYSQDAQSREELSPLPASNFFQRWRDDMMQGAQTPCKCGNHVEACMVCGLGSAQRQALQEEQEEAERRAHVKHVTAEAARPVAATGSKSMRELNKEAQENKETPLSSLEGLHGRQLTAEHFKCSKCNQDLSGLHTVYKGKGRPVLMCIFCNRASVMLPRNMTWPAPVFQDFSDEEQTAFWKECAELQLVNGEDRGLKYSRLRGLFKKHITRRRIEEWHSSEGGSFQPLEYYKRLGISDAFLFLSFCKATVIRLKSHQSDGEQTDGEHEGPSASLLYKMLLMSTDPFCKTSLFSMDSSEFDSSIIDYPRL